MKNMQKAVKDQADKLLCEYGRLIYSREKLDEAIQTCREKINSLNDALNYLPREDKNEQK